MGLYVHLVYIKFFDFCWVFLLIANVCLKIHIDIFYHYLLLFCLYCSSCEFSSFHFIVYFLILLSLLLLFYFVYTLFVLYDLFLFSGRRGRYEKKWTTCTLFNWYYALNGLQSCWCIFWCIHYLLLCFRAWTAVSNMRFMMYSLPPFTHTLCGTPCPALTLDVNS